jgi:large subunit ribosomal protein L4
MASLRIVDVTGAEQGSREASDSIFAVEFKHDLVHEVIVALQANARQGNHKTKTRKEVRGGGIKPFRQKGTGRARRGSSREPVLRGGGTVWGPRPRSYRQGVAARSRRQALCCVLSERLRGEKLSVLTGLAMDAPKTKPFAEILSKVSPEGRKTLIVSAGADKNVLLSARNIPSVTVRTAADLNALDVLAAQRIILQEEALNQLEERLK